MREEKPEDEANGGERIAAERTTKLYEENLVSFL